jgi:Flp pilus assembly protein TadG
MTRNFLRALFGHTRALYRDRRGVSAVEFCFIFPLLAALCLGTAAIIQGVVLQRKVTLIAATVANLVTLNTSVSSTDISNFFGASSLILVPASTTPVAIVLTCVAIDSSGNATVSWSKSLNATARTVGTSVSIPTAINVSSSYLIMTEVTYAYTPTVATNIVGTITLSKTVYMSPRLSSTVTYSS